MYAGCWSSLLCDIVYVRGLLVVTSVWFCLCTQAVGRHFCIIVFMYAGCWFYFCMILFMYAGCWSYSFMTFPIKLFCVLTHPFIAGVNVWVSILSTTIHSLYTFVTCLYTCTVLIWADLTHWSVLDPVNSGAWMHVTASVPSVKVASLKCLRTTCSVLVLVNHEPSQQSSKEKYKQWKWGDTARYYTCLTKTMLPTRKSVPRPSRQSDYMKNSWPS